MTLAALRSGSGEVTTANGRIGFVVSGGAEAPVPLVLLPSLGGGSRHWGEFGEILALKRPLVALDPPGFGRSSPPPLFPSIEGLAHELLAALESLGLRRFDLFGCSLGALLATRFALLAPERVNQLVLASGAERGRDFAPRRLSRALRLAYDFVSSPRPKAALARDIAATDEAGTPPTEPHVAGASWSRARVLQYVGAVLRHDASHELYSLTMPVLVVFGERDVILSVASQRRLTESLFRADFCGLPGVGHDVTNDAPEACARALLEFLNDR